MRISLSKRQRCARRDSSRSLLRVSVALVVALVSSCIVCLAQSERLTAVEYRSRVESASEKLDALAILDAASAAAERGETWARPESLEALPNLRVSTPREVRLLLPASLRVTRREGEVVEVDNRWLHRELTRYERMPETEAGVRERAEVLTMAVERLRALAARLDEADAAKFAKRDKEAEKGRLASILRGADFAEKKPRPNVLERLLEKIAQWLRDLFPDWKPIEAAPSTGTSRVAQYVIYIVAALAIVFVAWLYWRKRGTRVKKPKRREARVVLGERLEPDQTAADILADAERLARAGNLRGAIRKAYIALLCELGDRHVIKLAQHNTNRDYLQSVRESAPHAYGLFRPLTLNFERHWYGLEEADENDWNEFRTGCRRALEVK